MFMTFTVLRFGNDCQLWKNLPANRTTSLLD